MTRIDDGGRQIDATLHTRTWWARLLLRKKPYKVTFSDDSGMVTTEVSAEGTTPAEAYKAAQEMGWLFGDLGVTSTCPWDNDGNLIDDLHDAADDNAERNQE